MKLLLHLLLLGLLLAIVTAQRNGDRQTWQRCGSCFEWRKRLNGDLYITYMSGAGEVREDLEETSCGRADSSSEASEITTTAVTTATTTAAIEPTGDQSRVKDAGAGINQTTATR